MVHRKGATSKINEGLKRDIQQGYDSYYERKSRELRNKRLLWVVIGMVLLLLLGFAYSRLF